eukprot:Skav222243  [mRNA]  locus=scaffold3059:182341:183009:- [translate_table: standard]
MLSSLAIALLPLILTLSGCGSPELLAPALAEMPGISKSPESQATRPSQESQGQETARSEESRQLLATPGNPIPQSECSYQCSKLGFQHGGKCSSSNYCRCLVEYVEVETLWKGWVSEGICSLTTTPSSWDTTCDEQVIHKCELPPNKSRPLFLCSQPSFWDARTTYNGRYWEEKDMCNVWEVSLALPDKYWGGSYFERKVFGANNTKTCVHFADIAYACSSG